MTFGLLVFLMLGVRHSDCSFSDIGSPTFGLLDTSPRFSDIGSPTFGLLVFQIDLESDIQTPSFADSESECRTPSFSDIGSPTFGLLDTTYIKRNKLLLTCDVP